MLLSGLETLVIRDGHYTLNSSALYKISAIFAWPRRRTERKIFPFPKWQKVAMFFSIYPPFHLSFLK